MDIGQRPLAEKYGVKYTTLRRRSEREGWVEQRDAMRRKVDAEVTQKTVEAAADNAVIAREIQRDLLERLKRISMKYPQDATEVRQQKDGKTMVYKLTDLTKAYRDLTEDIVATNGDIEDLNPLVEMLQ